MPQSWQDSSLLARRFDFHDVGTYDTHFFDQEWRISIDYYVEIEPRTSCSMAKHTHGVTFECFLVLIPNSYGNLIKDYVPRLVVVMLKRKELELDCCFRRGVYRGNDFVIYMNIGPASRRSSFFGNLHTDPSEDSEEIRRSLSLKYRGCIDGDWSILLSGECIQNRGLTPTWKVWGLRKIHMILYL